MLCAVRCHQSNLQAALLLPICADMAPVHHIGRQANVGVMVCMEVLLWVRVSLWSWLVLCWLIQLPVCGTTSHAVVLCTMTLLLNVLQVLILNV
jgi:hypothetical protein